MSRDDPWMARHTRASADTLKGGGGYCTCPGMIHGWPDILGHPMDTLKGGGGGVLHLSRDDPWMARHTRASDGYSERGGGGGYCTCPGMIHGWPDILGHLMDTLRGGWGYCT